MSVPAPDQSDPKARDPALSQSKPALALRLFSADIVGRPVVWLAGTGVLILAGFLWLQYYAKPLAEAGKALSAPHVGQDRSTHWQTREISDAQAPETLPISQQSDQSRATAYRQDIATENRILPLLESGKDAFEAGVFAAPDQQGAWFSYQRILEIEPNHTIANNALSNILATLGERAEVAIQTRHYDEAEQWLAQLDLIQPDEPYQSHMRARITAQIQADIEAEQKAAEADARQKALDKHLAQGAKALKQEADPQIALNAFRDALNLEPENAQAKQGITEVQAQYARSARKHIEAARWAPATTAIQKLADSGGNRAQIEALQITLLDAQAAAEAVASQNTPPPEKAPPSGPNQAPRVFIDPVDDPYPLSGDLPVPTTPPKTHTIDVTTAKPSVEIEVIQPGNTSSQTNRAQPGQVEILSDPAQSLERGIRAYYSGDYETAHKRLRPLAENDEARAQFRLGIMHYEGRSVKKSPEIGKQWIARALPEITRKAQNQRAWAASDLGTAYELGIGVPQDLERAAHWYQVAANSGYAAAQANLGVLYATGKGVPYDRQKALVWLRKAAEQGNRVAELNLEALDAR